MVLLILCRRKLRYAIRLTSTIVTIALRPPATLFNGGNASELSFIKDIASRIATADVSATATIRRLAGGGVSGAGSDLGLGRDRLDSLHIRTIMVRSTKGFFEICAPLTVGDDNNQETRAEHAAKCSCFTQGMMPWQYLYRSR